MTRKTLSDLGVRALKARAAGFAYPDPELARHYVHVQPERCQELRRRRPQSRR
jgi:hypothetical protein